MLDSIELKVCCSNDGINKFDKTSANPIDLRQGFIDIARAYIIKLSVTINIIEFDENREISLIIGYKIMKPTSIEDAINESLIVLTIFSLILIWR